MKEQNIFDVDINQEMRESYLQYSMSVIVGRALPDVRDGLKPVHRRILFAMKTLRNTHDKPYKKSARVVGDVIGKYHPHGDMAVYDSIVRMAQDFSMRHPLVDGQGNFGSIDGDAPAAARYTEVRMTPLAEALLEDMDKETVPFGWNYDDTLLMPQVLPACYPNLLTNGSEGIAVGMASRIPPHNLGEVISATVALIQNPAVADEELMHLLPGPDFPTSGIIKAGAGLISAYKTGKGIITVESKVEIKEEKGRTSLIVTELPYQVNKARLIESMAILVKDKKIEGISDIRDESSREGMRVLIVLKKKENADVILNQLFRHTQLRSRFGIIFLALDRQNQPKVFSLKEMLKAFVAHRFDVITKRLIFDLRKARARAHILEGLKKALDSLTEVIKLIRGAKDTPEAREKLKSFLSLSTQQAQAILDMRLQKLTSLEREKIFQELTALMQEIENIKKTLSSEQAIYDIMEKELLNIKDKFATSRKTLIEAGGDDMVADKDLIPKEDVLMTLDTDGGIKQISLEEYRLQKRGGTGVKGSVSDIPVQKSLCVNTHSMLLVLTNRGRLYWLDAFRVPRRGRTAKGSSIRNLIKIEADEKIREVLPLDSLSTKGQSLCLMTQKGIFKKSALSLFSRPRKGGVMALKIDADDHLVSATVSQPKEDIFIVTKKGYCIRFPEESVRSIGRVGRGVRGIKLRAGDKVIGMNCVARDSTLSYMTVTELGFGKKTLLQACRAQSRGGKGITAHKITEKTGEIASARVVKEEHQLLVMSNQGQSIRFACREISVVGRASQGVRLMRLKTGEKVQSFSLLNEVDS